MTLPLALGAGATVASTIVNGIGARKVDKARNAALGAERGRQAEFDAEAAAINNGARDRYVDFSGQQDARAATLGDMFRSAPVATAENVIPPAASDLVSSEIANRMALAKAFSDQQGNALGNLRAFGDLFGDINRKQARDAGTIGQIGNFKRGSANVLGLELDNASHAGDKYKFFGDILAGAGKVGIMAGLGAPGSVATSATNPAQQAFAARGLGPLFNAHEGYW